MDVHRCRFVPYQPSAINAIAFSHPKTRTSKQAALARMAIGRANGDIEIWNPANGIWHQELVVRGGKDRSIDGLVWFNEPDQDLGDGKTLVGRPRLFSIGYTSTVTEWDLEKGKPKRHASGQHGDIWCIAAQPPASSLDKSNVNGPAHDTHTSNRLIAGTMDGELVMYSVDDDELRFQRVLVRSPTKKTQMVSIAFQSRKVVIVGCSDSTLRAYDITKGHLLRRMTLGSDLVGGSKDIIVWSVQCLPNGNIVSGDSTGQLCIWDGKTYTQMQRIQSHKQDILSLALSVDGSSIMSGGMDRRTVLYKQNGPRWAKVWGRRYHDHDVKCMAPFESGKTSVVVSGGPDSNPVIMPLKEIGRENHRMVSNLPQQPPINSARQTRLIVSWWEREVHVWVLRKSASDIVNDPAEDNNLNQNRKLLKTIVIKGESNISSATINPEGTLLIVSTATDVKAFRLEHNNSPSKPSDVKLSSVTLPPKLTGLGASQVQLSPDSSWLCIVQEGSKVLIAKIDINSTSALITQKTTAKLARIKRQIMRHAQNGGLGGYDRNITRVAFSPDSKMLAVADLAGFIDTWVLRRHGESTQNGTHKGADASSSESDSQESGQESVDAEAERWVRNPNGKLLPKLPSAPAVLSFSEDVPEANGDYSLLVITSNWTLLVFHPLEGALTPWSRRHPRRALPAPVLDLLDVAKGAVWQGSRAWIYGVSFLVMIDLGQDLPQPTQGTEVVTAQAGTKRKRIGHKSGAGGRTEQGHLGPHQIQRHVDGQEESMDLDDVQAADESNSDDEDMGDASGELTQLRRVKTTNGVTDTDLAETGTERKVWWMTYKYRPIFGMVPLDDGEVAIVERPMWDVDMPDRYFAGEEWER
jgi:U3 small nucleolar RNA-associated protein 4